MSASERIWASGGKVGSWNDQCVDAEVETEYLRADIAASQIAEKEAEIEQLTNLIDGEGCPDAEKIGALFSRAEAAEAVRDRLAADNARLRERGQAFANQVRAVTYHLNGQAYSSTLSELNAFDAALAAGEGQE